MKELYINRMKDEVFQNLFDNLESNIIKKNKCIMKLLKLYDLKCKSAFIHSGLQRNKKRIL